MLLLRGLLYKKTPLCTPDSHHISWSSKYEPSQKRNTRNDRVCFAAERRWLVKSNSAGNLLSCEYPISFPFKKTCTALSTPSSTRAILRCLHSSGTSKSV